MSYKLLSPFYRVTKGTVLFRGIGSSGGLHPPRKLRCGADGSPGWQSLARRCHPEAPMATFAVATLAAVAVLASAGEQRDRRPLSYSRLWRPSVDVSRAEKEISPRGGGGCRPPGPPSQRIQISFQKSFLERNMYFFIHLLCLCVF